MQCGGNWLEWIRMKADGDEWEALAVAVRERVWRKVRDRMVRRLLRFMVTFFMCERIVKEINNVCVERGTTRKNFRACQMADLVNRR